MLYREDVIFETLTCQLLILSVLSIHCMKIADCCDSYGISHFYFYCYIKFVANMLAIDIHLADE